MLFAFYGQNKKCSRLPMPAFFFDKIRVALIEQYYFLSENESYISIVKKNKEAAKNLNSLNVDRGEVLALLIKGEKIAESESAKALCRKHLQNNGNLSELLERLSIKIERVFREDVKPLPSNGDSSKASYDIYEDLGILSINLGFRLPPNISVVEYISYLKLVKKRIEQDALLKK